MIQLYAMDTFFYTTLGSYDLLARCQMLSELGYSGTHLTVWSTRAEDDISRLATIPSQHKLAVCGVYFMLDILDANSAQHTINLISRIPIATTIELAILAGGAHQHCSDASLDAQCEAYVAQICAIATTHGHQVVLYPHIHFWLERVEDAVRICQRVNHPRLGIAFNAFHWYAIGGRDIRATITLIQPYLSAVTICGTRMLPAGHRLPASIELIDEGELDLFHLLCELKRVGYAHPIGLQGFGIGGDVYNNLRRSRIAFNELIQRVALRSHWAPIHPPEHV
ncbi:MAG: sugar phosphate isomerase/epimerase family protein [Roseiflexaceae bacterium]|jgi:sugar phosphate isomerase/epimerase